MSWHFLHNRLYLIADGSIYDEVQALRYRFCAQTERAGVLLKILRQPHQGDDAERAENWASAWESLQETTGCGWICASLRQKSSFRRWEAYGDGARPLDGNAHRKTVDSWRGCPPQESQQARQPNRESGIDEESRPLPIAWDAIEIKDSGSGWTVCVNLLCSLAQEAVSSEAISWDGERFAPSNGPTILGKYCLPDSEMGFSHDSQSGMTSRPSTEVRGEGESMSSREDFPVRTSVQPEKEQESTANVPGCGVTWRESFAKFDHNSSSWRTPQCSLLAGLDVFSETWPRWGMMRAGECSELSIWEPPTSAKGSGLWPTIRSTDGDRGGRGDLIQAIRGNENSHFRPWPTPTARDWKSGTGAQKRLGHALPLSSQVGGQLNPPWVELLMGWPLDWTCATPISSVNFLLWEMGFSDDEKARERKALRTLRSGNVAEELSREIGGSFSVPEAAILLVEVCKYAGRFNEAWVLLACSKILEREVRGLRSSASPERSPHRSRPAEQLLREHPNALQTLPRLLALYGQKAWKDGSWENAVPRVAHGVARRVDRLKAIGNGQVSVVAATAFRHLARRGGWIA